MFLKELIDKIQNSLTKCECFLEKYQKLFGHKGPVGRSNEGRVKRKKSHSKRKAQKRKLKFLCKQCQYLVNELSPDVKTVPEEFVFKQSMKSVNDIYKLKGNFKTNNIDIDNVPSVGVKYMKALNVLFAKDSFTNEAKCLIADNLNSFSASKFWYYYEQNAIFNESESDNSENECEEKEMDEDESKNVSEDESVNEEDYDQN